MLRRSQWEHHYSHERVVPFEREHRESSGAQFMRRLGEHLELAEKEAMESGGHRVVRCKCPGGDEIRVLQISLEDEYFVRVEGIDEFNQHREFTGHHSMIGISIEVVAPLEDFERNVEDLESNGDDGDLIN